MFYHVTGKCEEDTPIKILVRCAGTYNHLTDMHGMKKLWGSDFKLLEVKNTWCGRCVVWNIRQAMSVYQKCTGTCL